MWKIGNIEIKNKVVLAPMAGISNPSFMKICEGMGVGYAITELISSEALIRGNKKTFDMLNGIEEVNFPVAIQLFGANVDSLVEAGKILTNKYKNIIIDINMGCPVPKVATRSGAGSALMKDKEKVKEIVSRMVKELNVPVTVKIRSGWDKNSINAVEIAKICEASGASAISVHARTRSEGYSGKADWNIIKEVKDNVSIPVIGNGDIKTIYDAKRMLNETNCDAVMIGRATQGNPWILKEIERYLDYNEIIDKPTNLDRINMCIKHFEYLLKYQNEKNSVLEIRNHLCWYLKGIKNSNKIKDEVFATKNKDKINEILNNYKKEIENNES